MDAQQILDAAKLAAQQSSPDAKRAAMILADTSSRLSQAMMIHLYERAQAELTREIARLTNNDLATFHVIATKKRVDEILDILKSECERNSKTLVTAHMINGKLIARTRAKQDITSSFDLSAREIERVQRLTDQITGSIGFVTNSTKKVLNEKINAACTQAQTLRTADPLPPDIHYPSIEDKKSYASSLASIESSTKKASSMMQKNEELLKSNPLDFAMRVYTASKSLVNHMRTSYVIGRREADQIRQKTLLSVAQSKASNGLINAQQMLVSELLRDGITAFSDRSGRRWTLNAYANMAVRTTSKQCSNLGELFDDEQHDLYMIVDNHSNCPICSRYEGRVYSRSGMHPKYPPLASAFGKINPNDSDSLDNTYLTIHPNCRHTLIRFYESTHTAKQLKKIQKKSSPETNPFQIDPRTKQEIDKYKERERVLAEENESVRIFRQMLMFIPARELGTWVSFHKHFLEKDAKYQELMSRYLKLKAQAKRA